jgi:hypothetical protein
VEEVGEGGGFGEEGLAVGAGEVLKGAHVFKLAIMIFTNKNY